MNSMCYHPWIGLDISPQGQFRPCCKFDAVAGHSLEEYQTSSLVEDVRQQFLQGQRPSQCHRCWRDEDAGIKSKRELDIQYYLDNQIPDLSHLQFLGMSFGNTCNLACRICNSSYSSRWQPEEKKIIEVFPDTKIHTHQKFYQDSKLLDQVLSLSTKVKSIQFSGGESFVTGVQEHLEFLGSLANPAEVSLHYITNTTVFPSDEFWQLWKKFKHVDIQLSIDGIDKHFEYQRWPANWESCLDNIKRYQQNAVGNIKLSISHSVSIFNVLYLPEFIKWCLTNKLPVPYLGLVTTPSYYNITVLPKAAKEVVCSKLKGGLMSNIAQAMMATDNSNELDTTLKYVKILDKQRNQSFPETFPELYQLIGEPCHNLYQQY
jgi:MoaA/NifB/PqqE/SkfB family radical SAM enzyme